MPVRYYTKPVAHGNTPAVTIRPDGGVYLSSAIGRAWPATCYHVLPGWDEDARELHLRPVEQAGLGTYAICNEHHGDALAFTAVGFLRESGLMAARYRLAAEWRDGEVVVRIPD